MHGYFVSLKLYDAARVITNPFAYAEHREKLVREKMEKMAETRIRAKKEVGVKVNKALAEKILRDEEREKKREEKRRLRKAQKDAERDGVEMDVDNEGDMEDVEEEEETVPGATEKPSLLNDPRFTRLFEDPAFAVDEDSREYALMNPSAAAHKRNGTGERKTKTAVEEEEEESDKASSDGLDDSDESESDGSDSSDAGGEFFYLFIVFIMELTDEISQNSTNSILVPGQGRRMSVLKRRMREIGNVIVLLISISFPCVRRLEQTAFDLQIRMRLLDRDGCLVEANLLIPVDPRYMLLMEAWR